MWWNALATVEAEHPGLVSGTRDLISSLRENRERFGLAMVDYMYGDRPVALASHLEAAGLLTASGHQASALTVLRTALEHTLTDSLLFNARRRRVRYVNATPEWEARQRAAINAGEEGTADIESIERQGKDVLIVRATYRLTNPDGEVVGRISPYHVAMEHHSPLVGKKADQADRWRYVGLLADQRAHAVENAQWWKDYLAWPAIKDNLVLNGLYSERDARRLEVHYGFLSSFTHAHNHGYRVGHSHSNQSGTCHFCKELTLLYMATIGILEQRALAAHCVDRDPSFVTPGSEIADRLVDVIDYFWFPGLGSPTVLDRHREVLQRQHDSGTALGRVVEPGDLTEDEVAYYGDPMSRLVSLHQSSSEMVTGLTYRSPWPQAGTWPLMHP